MKNRMELSQDTRVFRDWNLRGRSVTNLEKNCSPRLRHTGEAGFQQAEPRALLLLALEPF